MPKTLWLVGMGTISLIGLVAASWVRGRLPAAPVHAKERPGRASWNAEPGGDPQPSLDDDRLQRYAGWLAERHSHHLASRERMLAVVAEAAQSLEDCAEAAGANDELQRRLDRALDQIHRVARELRREISPLCGGDLDPADLAGSLHRLASEVEVASLLRVERKLDPSVQAYLSYSQAEHLLHLLREALANAVRHAQANRLAMRATVEGRRLVISLADDGVGFDFIAADMEPFRGLGKMHHRAEAAGALLQIESAPGAGTIVTVALPVNQANGGGPGR